MTLEHIFRFFSLTAAGAGPKMPSSQSGKRSNSNEIKPFLGG
jgi:hypothetical protein